LPFVLLAGLMRLLSPWEETGTTAGFSVAP